MNKQKGFSLIELLIVVAIILIIAAIAVPNLLRSRMAANEASAAGSLRSIATANVTYTTTYNAGFAGELSHMGPPAAPPATSDAADLLDSALSGILPVPAVGNAVKSGYVFAYIPGNGTAGDPGDPIGTYSTSATPVTPGSTGQSTFCIDQTNVVKKDTAGAALVGALDGCETGDFAVGATIAPM